MKYDFQNLNIEPMPNPKPLRVERIIILRTTDDGRPTLHEQGIVRNVTLHPYAIIHGRGY
jgi:hypothetical protein